MDFDAMAAWCASYGVHPVLGGFIAGVVAVLLVRMLLSAGRDKDDGNGVGNGSRQADAGSGTSGFVSGGVTTQLFRTAGTIQRASIRVVVNGKEVNVPEAVSGEIFDLIAADRKIEAIKLLRTETGLDLLDAKTLVETLAQSPHGH